MSCENDKALAYTFTSLDAAIAEHADEVKELRESVKNLTVRFDAWSAGVDDLKESGSKKRIKKVKDIYNIYSGELGSKIKAVVEHYMKYHPNALKGLSKKSKSYLRVKDRLHDGFSVTELSEAIDGMHRSPFHMGQNSQGTKYLTLELCMRGSDQVNRFIEMSKDPTVNVGANTNKTIQSATSWLGRD